MIGAIDRRDHAAAAKTRPVRRRTSHIIVHRTISVDADKDGDRDFDDVIRFFTQDPEGVATVAVAGSYASKGPLIKNWRAHGIPAVYQGKGFVPYHVLVDSKGGVAQTLDLAFVGAHAGSWNDRSVAVAVVSDPRTEEPTPAMVTACTDVIAQLIALYPGAVVVDHDFVNKMIGAPHKGCVGALFPLRSVVARAAEKAGPPKH